MEKADDVKKKKVFAGQTEPKKIPLL